MVEREKEDFYGVYIISVGWVVGFGVRESRNCVNYG
jgi:hypothetical protein